MIRIFGLASLLMVLAFASPTLISCAARDVETGAKDASWESLVGKTPEEVRRLKGEPDDVGSAKHDNSVPPPHPYETWVYTRAGWGVFFVMDGKKPDGTLNVYVSRVEHAGTAVGGD